MSPANEFDASKGFNFEHNPQGKPSLADLGTVASLVRGFVDLTMGAYHDFQTDKTDRGTAMAAIKAEAKTLGDTIMGRSEAYHVNSWHSPARLGANIRAQQGVSFQATNDAGEAIFLWLAAQAITAAKDMDDGTAAEQAMPCLLDAIKSAVELIAGVNG